MIPLGTCPICNQQYPADQLNDQGECVFCATTLPLWGTQKAPKVTGGKICPKCKVLLRKYTLFQVEHDGCPKCGYEEKK